MEFDINKIVNERINSMIENGELEKLIADGVESSIKKSISNATNDYNWRSQIEGSLKKTISDVASKVNFSAYSNFLLDRMNHQVERYTRTDMIEQMQDAFEKTYFTLPDDIKLSDILNKYKEYIEIRLDNEEREKWGKISLSFIQESSFIRIKAGCPGKGKYGYFDKGLELSLFKHSSGENKAVISWIRFDGNDFRNAMDLSGMCDFEILLFNLMFTRKEIEIDINEDFEWDANFECEYEDDW